MATAPPKGDNLAVSKTPGFAAPQVFLKTPALRNADWQQIDAVSFDVFDTLLLRKPISQRARYALMARNVVDALGDSVRKLRWQDVFESRLVAERNYFGSTEAFDPLAGVRLEDIVAMQIKILNLSQQKQQTFLDAEMAVEKNCVFANAPLIQDMCAVAETSRPVIAISDTLWSSSMLAELIEATAGDRLPLREIYSSADCGITKHGGQLFQDVARRASFDLPRTLHVGDDVRADREMARAAGSLSAHIPRSRSYNVLRKTNAALFEIRRASSQPRVAKIATEQLNSETFGATIVGPILAELFLSLYAYLRATDPRTPSVALFCSRGGLLLHSGFERFLTASGLTLSVPRENLMVSRLVAARAALLNDGIAAGDELRWEFRNESMRNAATALMGSPIDLPAEWDRTFDLEVFKQLMATEAASPVWEVLNEQSRLFEKHLDMVKGDAERLILVDTGLYGSTLRLLQEAFPDRAWECVMIARCDYKGHDRSHFANTTGLLVEKNSYTMFDRRSVILRYWQMIEDLFEPELPSVKHFYETADDEVRSNLEQVGWEAHCSARKGTTLESALNYIDQLTADDLARIPSNANEAWKLLKRMIAFPNNHEARILSTGKRSRDFGHEGSIEALVPIDELFPTRASLSRSCWKEGAIAISFGRTRMFWQGTIEMAHILRSWRSFRSPGA